MCVILVKGKSCNRLSIGGGFGILTMCPSSRQMTSELGDLIV